MRSQIIQAPQASARLKGDVPGDGFFLIKKKKKSGKKGGTDAWRFSRRRELLSYSEDKKRQSSKCRVWDLSCLPSDVCTVVWTCKVWVVIPRGASSV